MAHGFRFSLVACFSLLLAACHAEPPPPAPAVKKVAKKASAKAEAKGEGKKKVEPEPAEAEKFALPFAWEAAKEEPLALTRAFLREALSDNESYMQHGEKFFAAFADKQVPRATVVTCADSRVHNQAWDATPENDDFTIRNIGNQVANLQGSVEYGIEHLHTPLLLVVGHTGCGAVKAAMGDISKLSEPIRRELEHLRVPKASPDKSPEVAWAEAVIGNVNDQVNFSLKRFAEEVHEGKLTVVGAVYDFRNDLAQGSGKLVIVNVNGNSDPERMLAFVEAVNGRSGEAKAGKEKKLKSPHGDETASAVDAVIEIAKGAATSAHAPPAAEAEAGQGRLAGRDVTAHEH